MNARSYFATGSAGILEPIEELSRISLVRALDSEAGLLPAGSSGTVVSVYDNGAAYCVEFTEPLETLLTVLCGDVVAISEDNRASSVERPGEVHRRA